MFSTLSCPRFGSFVQALDCTCLGGNEGVLEHVEMSPIGAKAWRTPKPDDYSLARCLYQTQGCLCAMIDDLSEMTTRELQQLQGFCEELGI